MSFVLSAIAAAVFGQNSDIMSYYSRAAFFVFVLYFANEMLKSSGWMHEVLRNNRAVHFPHWMSWVFPSNSVERFEPPTAFIRPIVMTSMGGFLATNLVIALIVAVLWLPLLLVVGYPVFASIYAFVDAKFKRAFGISFSGAAPAKIKKKE